MLPSDMWRWFSPYPINDYYTNPERFWNRDCPQTMIAIKDQGNTAACVAFATTNILYHHIKTIHSCTVELSTQQIYDHFSNIGVNRRPDINKGINLEAALEYVSRYGLLRESDYPWTGNPPKRFVMPSSFPLYILRAGFAYIEEREFVEHLNFSPILSTFKADDRYKCWVRTGSLGVFHKTVGVVGKKFGHCVTIVGYGQHFNSPPYYIVQDSYGSTINMGFKKIAAANFTRGYIVSGVHGVWIMSARDPYYAALTHSR